jgi:hypothetical protein
MHGHAAAALASATATATASAIAIARGDCCSTQLLLYALIWAKENGSQRMRRWRIMYADVEDVDAVADADALWNMHKHMHMPIDAH